MNLYSIFDILTGKFGAPWAAVNDNQAKRSFERLASDTTIDIYFRPSDYTLYALGELDEATGTFRNAQVDITPPLSS
ncbi:MAG: nonstructural protein [Microvirus sp.]|nr:MAG: nonstructural protein [Microvirus sp.]